MPKRLAATKNRAVFWRNVWANTALPLFIRRFARVRADRWMAVYGEMLHTINCHPSSKAYYDEIRRF